MGLLKTDVAVLTLATWTLPSFPGYVCWTLAKGHWLVKRTSSLTITRSASCMLVWGGPPFLQSLQLLQILGGPALPKVLHHRLTKIPSSKHGLRSDHNFRICLELLAHQEMAWGEGSEAIICMASGTRGQLFKQGSTCVATVDNSSKVKRWVPMTLRRWYLTDFTAASHNPPKCGARSGMQCHCTRLDKRYDC